MDTKNSILSLRGVKKQYSGAPNPAIEDITLDIEQGKYTDWLERTAPANQL